MKNIILNSTKYSEYKDDKFIEKLKYLSNLQQRKIAMYEEIIRDCAELTKAKHQGVIRDKVTEMTKKLYEYICTYELEPNEPMMNIPDFYEYSIDFHIVGYILRKFDMSNIGFINCYYSCRSVLLHLNYTKPNF